MVNSLKRAQRAEIDNGNGKDIIDDLYVDPLPKYGIREKMASDETVFLIGRKGTGKSTIFAAAQNQIRKRQNELSLYIDVKTLYSRSNAYQINSDNLNLNANKLIIGQNFIKEVLKEILIEIDKNLKEKSLIQKIVSQKSYKTAKEKIAELKSSIHIPQYRDITLGMDQENLEANHIENQISGQQSINIGTKNSSIGGGLCASYLDGSDNTSAFTSNLIREFSMTQYMDNIKSILNNAKIKKLHIFLDDFSELEELAQIFFVDIILAPLNNWSEKFFRFKVACYPGRVYLGDIDKTKISEEYIDHYDLYKGSKPDLNEIEEKAIEFLDRLLTIRFKYYLNKKPEELFQIDRNNSWNEYLELLFYATTNVPRILGYLMDAFCDKAIIYDKKINKNIITNAARDYFENKLKPFFDKGTKILETKNSLLDRYGQEKLLASILEKAKENKYKRAKSMSLSMKKSSTIQTSHFYIPKHCEKYISTLELNFLVSKYFEQSDRDGQKVCVYALNYGLCVDNNIAFGRPRGDRKYYISRIFDYEEVLDSFLKSYKVYVCDTCGYKYNYGEYEVIKQANDVCFKGCCKKSTYKEIYTFSDAIVPKGLKDSERLLEIQFDVLAAIKELNEAYATPISQELDCYYQMVNAATRKLLEKGLVTKEKKFLEGKLRSVYSLTSKAQLLYFS